jgi:uncharacterized protein
MKLSRYCIIWPDLTDPDSVILFSTKKASAVNIEKKRLEDIANDSITADDYKTLTDLELIVNSEEEERAEMLGFLDELNALDTRLSAYVTMNLDCNLACPYCFEGTRRGKHYMSEEMANNIIKFIEKNLNGKDEFYITFYGGEPLLSLKLVQQIAGRFRQIADHKGIKFSFSFVTNGTLLNEAAVRKLKPLGLKAAAVTLDGPEAVHNVSRPFASGAGSFNAIVNNIRAVCDMVEINIGGNFSEGNYRQFPFLLDEFIQRGITPDRVKSVKFDPVFKEREGIATPDYCGGCRSINEKWLFDAGIYLRDETMKRGFPTPEVMPSFCVIERNNMFIINYDGTIYKCPGLIGQREFCVGDVVNGVGDYSVSHRLNNWQTEECLECVYLPLCFGGCRYLSLLRGSAMETLDCRKPYYDACLEGLVRQDLSIA